MALTVLIAALRAARSVGHRRDGAGSSPSPRLRLRVPERMVAQLWYCSPDLPAHHDLAGELAPFSCGGLFPVPATVAMLGAPQPCPNSSRRPIVAAHSPSASHDDARLKGVVRHGYMTSRNGARLRLLCRACGRTFCSRRCTAYYRLQHPRSHFDQFADLLAEGLSAASLPRVLGVCPATISRWLRRAAAHAGAVSDEHDAVEEPLELQFDELSARPASEPRSPWIFTGIEVSTRYWVASAVGRRSTGSTSRDPTDLGQSAPPRASRVRATHPGPGAVHLGAETARSLGSGEPRAAGGDLLLGRGEP